MSDSEATSSLTLEGFAEKLSKHPRLIIADDYELTLQRSATASTHWADGKAGMLSSSERIWVSLRLIHRKQPGRAVVTSLHEDSIKSLVEAAFESSRRSSVDPWFRFPMWRSVSKKAEAISGSFAPISEGLEDSTVRVDERFETTRVETLIKRKTEKFQLSHRRDFFSSALSTSLPSEGIALDEFRSYSQTPNEPRNWLQDLMHRTRERAGARSITDRELSAPFIFAPAAGAVLVRMLAGLLGADAAQRGESPLADKFGEAVLSPELGLVDDGGLAGGPDAAPFDLEGVQTQRTVLVEKGVLKSLLYDCYTATRENRRSTGNFLRGVSSLHPRVRVSHLFFTPGTKSRADLLGRVREGIWLENIEAIDPVAAHSNVFRILASGWRLSAGQCVEPVKEIRLQFNVLELLSCAAAVSDDLEQYGSFGSPSILFSKMPLR